MTSHKEPLVLSYSVGGIRLLSFINRVGNAL